MVYKLICFRNPSHSAALTGQTNKIYPKDKRPCVMKEITKSLLIMGLIGFCVFGSQLTVALYKTYGQSKDIWWTPVSLPVSYTNARNQVLVYLSGNTLKALAEENRIMLRNKDNELVKVNTDMIQFRLNNWDRVKSRYLQTALISAFFFGVSITCLAIGWILMRVERSNKVKTDR